MSTLLMSLTLALTIVASVCLGIAAGYVAIVGILNAFGRNRTTEKASAPTLASTAGTSGS